MEQQDSTSHVLQQPQGSRIVPARRVQEKKGRRVHSMAQQGCRQTRAGERMRAGKKRQAERGRGRQERSKQWHHRGARSRQREVYVRAAASWAQGQRGGRLARLRLCLQGKLPASQLPSAPTEAAIGGWAGAASAARAARPAVSNRGASGMPCGVHSSSPQPAQHAIETRRAAARSSETALSRARRRRPPR